MKVIWATLQARAGIPYVDRGQRYHDHKLNGMIVAGRHAVALDERRQHFHSKPWGGVDALNKRLGFKVDDKRRPIQEMFFPGYHGSIGGGGNIRGLSDSAFDWVLEGARSVGLKLTGSATSAIYTILPEYQAPLRNTTVKPKRISVMNSLTSDRSHKPKALYEVHESAQRRWCHGGLNKEPYRTKNLTHLSSSLDALSFPKPHENKMLRGKIQRGREVGKYSYHTVVNGETLRKIAKRYTGNPDESAMLFEINKGIIFHPDKIFVGQVIRVPRLPKTKESDTTVL